MNKKEVLELLKKLVEKSNYEKVWVNDDGGYVYEPPTIDLDRFVGAILKELTEL